MGSKKDSSRLERRFDPRFTVLTGALHRCSENMLQPTLFLVADV